MPQRDEAPFGAPCWADVMSSDVERARSFYGDLFGWTSEVSGEEFGGYVNFSKDGRLVAGCVANDGTSGAPDGWSVYLATRDAAATEAAAVASGGQVMVPAMAVADLGSMAILGDVGGAVIGVWQPGLHKGFGLVLDPGAPAWFELHTRSYDAAVDFYRDVFGWDTHVMSDTPEFRYTTLGEGPTALAGIMDATGYLPAGAPSAWSTYFAVEDTDKALATAVDLGGSIVQPPEDTPYGRLAQVADPTGATFKLVAGMSG